MAHIKESLDEIKTQKDELQSKYENVKKILSHYVKKDKINKDRLNNMVTASTQVDSVLEACTCSNQNTVAPETKLKLAEEQLNEIKINFQKEQASLISKNQNLETDYAMLKDLYRQIIVDYNNYLRNNEINTLSVNEENDEEMDEISKLKQELKLKELINHTNWLEHSRVLEICYKETDELAIKLSQKEKKIEEMSIELRKLQTIHNHCHKDDEIKESKKQLDVLKNDLLKKDKNLEEVTNEFRKLQAVHNHCLKDDEIKESKKQLNILKHELEEITNEFQKLQSIHNHCVTYDEIKKLQKKIEILNNELIKKETNYTFLKIHNKTLTLQFAKEKRNNPDISNQNLEIPEEEDSQDESCGVEDNTTTHLKKEINRLNKLVSCKDMVYSMHWNQHLFMLEELYQEKEKLESQLSNRNNEIEKITELNKSTENRENMSNKNQKDESTQTNIENNTPSIHKNEQNVIVINKELEDCQIKIEDLEKRNQMLTNLCAIRQRKIDQLLDQVPVGEDN